MPLVVPGVMTQSGDKTEEWSNKLVGKKLSDDPSDETVRLPSSNQRYSTRLPQVKLAEWKV